VQSQENIDEVVSKSPEVKQPVITPTVQYAYLPYAPNYGYYGTAARPVVQTPILKTSEEPTVKALYTQQTYYGAAAPHIQQEKEAQDISSVVDSNIAVVPKAAAIELKPVVPVVAAPVSNEGSQYHAQDDFGQYSFGYSDSNSVKQEVKTADGVIRGAYSYVDSNGILQTVNYIADALGFRVGATNLPVHEVPNTVDVASTNEPETYAPVEQKIEEKVAPETVPVITPQVSYAYLPYAANYGYSAPSVVAPSNDLSNAQYHAQDDYGQYNYGYSSPSSTKQEVKTGDGVTRGSYSYVDANGLLQTVNYISDAMGFRVAATNLPVHVVAEANPVLVNEEPAVEKKNDAVLTPQVPYTYLPYAPNYAYTIPVGGVTVA